MGSSRVPTDIPSRSESVSSRFGVGWAIFLAVILVAIVGLVRWFTVKPPEELDARETIDIESWSQPAQPETLVPTSQQNSTNRKSAKTSAVKAGQ